MKLLFPTLALLMFFGCGRHTKIEQHETTQADIVSKGESSTAIGYAHWDDREYEIDCDIYLMPVESYPSVSCYEAALRHEVRHCYEFDFHQGKCYLPGCIVSDLTSTQ